MRSALHVLTSAQKSLKRVEGSRAATSLSAWMTSCSDAAGQLAAVALVDEAGWGLGEVEELEKEGVLSFWAVAVAGMVLVGVGFGVGVAGQEPAHCTFCLLGVVVTAGTVLEAGVAGSVFFAVVDRAARLVGGEDTTASVFKSLMVRCKGVWREKEGKWWWRGGGEVEEGGEVERQRRWS